MEETSGSSGSATVINSSNIGFQLLKKQGWKEGTGLGISEQGRLEPVETYVKNNKRGLGADKVKKKAVKPDHCDASKGNNQQEHSFQKKTKALSKRMRKMQEFEKKMQEKEFERAFFREFWPENV
ncbi:G patch domain and ankyrin repeat-containing protein 1 homolog [Abrus precatorius]|uniref:G patch domain and ankyrin repeat-containing protein 1 homolog n=1 Tax=Abrus precatorius TaxID=3816 RepID=A0A8B8ME39_ABRPR|nr:G patch domain and ankyrin repeat-containing protein 1 homolog [Abrus precatorius]